MAPTLQQAKAAYLHQAVAKQFSAGLFEGRVAAVNAKVKDAAGVTWPLLYLIEYEDGDEEHMTPEELAEVLVDKAGAQQRLEQALAAAPAPHPQHRHADENDENQAGAGGAGAAKLMVRRVLGDATVRSRNGGGGEERRSRRDSKRRMDEDYEYEDPRGAKRASTGGDDDDSAAARARFGIRAPGQLSAAQEIANMLSESEEHYPVGEGGMRLAGLAGHLKKIEVVNFMCHENFTMDFGAHVTFVSGTNGSGKSAVLQALQCCLGVKASNTGRANSFKKFIRTGADECIIRVTVCNKPYKNFDGFRHATFGDTITVERRICAVGSSSSYALKDHTGRIHGRKRDDLDAMLQTLNLNAANPVCVMTQDTARNFLAGSSSKADQEKYQLYMEATSLEAIKHQLDCSRAQIRQMDEAVAQIREMYEKMRAEHAQLQKSITALEGIEEWRQEVAQLEQVITWAAVVDAAEQLAQCEQMLHHDNPARVAAAQASLEALQREYAALKAATDGKAHFLHTYNERASALTAEVEALKGRVREAHRHAKGAEAKIRSLQAGLQEAQAAKETLEAAVKEVEGDVVQATQAVVAQYQQQLEEAQAADGACQQEVAGIQSTYQEAAAATKAAHERAEALRGQLHAASGQLHLLQQQMQGIREAGRSKLAAFGGKPVVALVAAIGRAKGQFSRPPIGPMGQHLTLEDTRWAHAAEVALSFQLNAFLVHSMRDAQLLRQMINTHFSGGVAFKPQVYVINFDLPQHTIPLANQPPPSVPTLYRLLSCPDKRLAAPILNNLVDQAHIERIALGSDHNQCTAIGWSTRNVVACISLDGRKYYKRGSTNSSIPPPHWLHTARLGQSAAQQASELEAEAQRVSQELQQLQAEEQRARQEVAAADQAERSQRLALQQVRRRQYEAQSALTQLTQQPPPELTAATQAGGDEALQADIWQAAQACIDLELQLRERQAELEQAQQAEAEAHASFDESRAAIARLEEENEQFLSTYHQEVQKLGQAEADVQEQQEMVEELQAMTSALQRRYEQQAADVQQLEDGALQMCTREAAAAAREAVEARLRAKRAMDDEQVAALMSAELLRKKVEQVERRIRDHEQEAGGSLEELQVAFAASARRMGREGRDCRQAIATYEVVEHAHKLRSKKLNELDHSVEALVNQKFRHYMHKKKHSGKIKLDRQARTLQLKVEMNCNDGSKKEGGAVKDLKQLSGGERSYTTVAFTLALGGQTEMPFRAMDEFDVFMDAINRRVAMQNLFNFAKANPELQFIFLTPQDISAVENARQACQQQGPGHEVPDGFVKIVQMRPARANASHA